MNLILELHDNCEEHGTLETKNDRRARRCLLGGQRVTNLFREEPLKQKGVTLERHTLARDCLMRIFGWLFVSRNGRDAASSLARPSLATGNNRRGFIAPVTNVRHETLYKERVFDGYTEAFNASPALPAIRSSSAFPRLLRAGCR